MYRKFEGQPPASEIAPQQRTEALEIMTDFAVQSLDDPGPQVREVPLAALAEIGLAYDVEVCLEAPCAAGYDGEFTEHGYVVARRLVSETPPDPDELRWGTEEKRVTFHAVTDQADERTITVQNEVSMVFADGVTPFEHNPDPLDLAELEMALQAMMFTTQSERREYDGPDDLWFDDLG
ncbi:MAG TPA: hypothetical protein VJP80_03380 [Candidatus Saccharimonadales bacterium]|nr:hypothetical protein [Candidatus Saccharimonadales bacterium]